MSLQNTLIKSSLLLLAALSAFMVNAPDSNARSQQNAAVQPARNPFVAALEKKIAGQENEPAEKVFSNLQLLKGMPAGRLLRK